MKLYFLLIPVLFFFSCDTEPPRRIATPMDLQAANLIPLPTQLQATGSSFALLESTTILNPEDEVAAAVGTYLAELLRPATGFLLAVDNKWRTPEIGDIQLSLKEDFDENPEAYELAITEDQLHLTASTAAGLFRGVQTLRQLLPATIETQTKIDTLLEVPTGIIRDIPTYQYRGVMLDVARHFFSVADVKKFIDHIAMYKMNVLHLHLADDQGWRIEIKSRPKLTEIGGSTEVGGGKGGFYTQAQYKEIVRYAAKHHITIVPEIDMPGHTNAALASYAELNCDGKARKLYTGMRVGFSTLCVRSEATYDFITDVLKELATLTPGPYLHIGGDESDATKPADYVYFLERVAKIVDSLDKRMMGWDDITAADLPQNAVAQHWIKPENAAAAIAKNLDIVMSPAPKAYLDMKYDSLTTLGLNWAAYIEVDSAYLWSPATYLDGLKKEHLLGIEAPLWSETIEDLEDIEQLLFPRLLGYAEIGWTPDSLRQWDDYRQRLGAQAERLAALRINYYPSPLIEWTPQ